MTLVLKWKSHKGIDEEMDYIVQLILFNSATCVLLEKPLLRFE